PCVHPSLPLGPPTLSLSIHDSHRHLHSFPTRRSSDLSGADLEGATGAATILDNDSRTAPPAVQLRSPAAGGIFLEGNPIVIEADVTEGSSPIELLQFFSNGALIGQVTAEPYRFVLGDVPIGSHTIRAVVIDSSG